MVSDLLEQETRRSIFECIRNYPGIHLREVARRTGLKLSLVDYHIRGLIKREMLVQIKEDGYRRFYVLDHPGTGRLSISSQHRRMMHLLRQKVPLDIVTILLEKESCTHGEMLSLLGISGSTLSYHLSRMRQAGLVERSRSPRGNTFRLSRPAEVLWLLKKGNIKHPTVVDGFISLWKEFY